VANWLSLLHGQDAYAVVNGIERSPEARTRLVDGWYQTYLGRSAVNGEEQGWVAGLLRGASEEMVLGGILGSEEFLYRVAGLTSSGTSEQSYLQALYSLLLQRTGSDGEVQDWVPAVTSSGRATVALAFLESVEYRSDVVQAYYVSTAFLNGAKSAPRHGPCRGGLIAGLALVVR